MTSDQQAELEQYRKAAREYHESVERRLKTLENKVDALSKFQPVVTSSSRCIVTEAHIEKLERIKAAAEACFPDGSAACWPGAWKQLREALGEIQKPKVLVDGVDCTASLKEPVRLVTEAQAARWERIEGALSEVVRGWDCEAKGHTFWNNTQREAKEALKP